MPENEFTFPFDEVQKKFVEFAFITIRHLLNEDTNNPLTEALDAYLEDYDDVNIASINALMDKYEASTDVENWHVSFSEAFSFYILFDLIARTYHSDYFMNMIGEIHDATEETNSFDMEDMMKVRKGTLNIVDSLLNILSAMKTNKFINGYMWKAERFPDPVTGISPKLAAYNHIPNLPKDTKQMTFSDYNDGYEITIDLKVDPAILYIDLHCLLALMCITGDEENPPALIINAYFPNMCDQITELLAHNPMKNKRRKKWKLTEGEFGLIYACLDLYGKINASSYDYLLTELVKKTPFSIPLDDKESETLNDEAKATVLHLIEMKVKAINENFGDLDVIKAYREVVEEMVWFDD